MQLSTMATTPMSPRAEMATLQGLRNRAMQAWYAQIPVVFGSKPACLFADATHPPRRLLERSP